MDIHEERYLLENFLTESKGAANISDAQKRGLRERLAKAAKHAEEAQKAASAATKSANQARAYLDEVATALDAWGVTK